MDMAGGQLLNRAKMAVTAHGKGEDDAQAAIVGLLERHHLVNRKVGAAMDPSVRPRYNHRGFSSAGVALGWL